MVDLRQSPFRVDKIEDDPHAFGNRPGEVVACVQALLNNRHVLISGPRGIGKSSLACQIQNLYKGDYTLAKRCNININLGNFLTCYYACGDDTDLGTLALDLVFRIEKECDMLKSFKTGGITKFKTSINFGIIKSSLETDINSTKPSSIAMQLVSALARIYKSLMSYTRYEGLNILIDELDELNQKINFGHFLKIIHEYLDRDNLNNINFIFAGQKGVYNHLHKQDPSVDRILRHVPISKLEYDECKHILAYASSIKSRPPFSFDIDAEELILKISSGFPYVIQLLGDAAFSVMKDPNCLRRRDVLKGIEKLLRSDKSEKYRGYFYSLSSEQRKILALIARYRSPELPMIIPLVWILDEVKPVIDDRTKIERIVKSLHKAGHIIVNEEKEICQFNDELFRIYLALMYIEAKDVADESDMFVDISDIGIRDMVDQIEKAKFKDSWEYDGEIFEWK